MGDFVCLCSWLSHVIVLYFSHVSHPELPHLSRHAYRSAPNFSHHSTMRTPSTSILVPYPPDAPVPMPIASDAYSWIPVLRLPPPLATSQIVILPTTISNQLPSTTIHQNSVPVNPVFRNPHFLMTVPFYTRGTTSKPSAIPVPDSALQHASLPQSPCTFRSNFSCTNPRVTSYEYWPCTN